MDDNPIMKNDPDGRQAKKGDISSAVGILLPTVTIGKQ